MENSLQVGTHFINGCVERQLGGGLMGADRGAVGMNANDILTAQGALVNARRGDPDVAFPRIRL